MENIHSGHRQRLRQSFLDNGLASFQPHNILELLLFYARPRINTNEIAHRLLSSFKTLSGVFNAPYEELVRVEGLGENGAVLLKLIPQLLNVYSVDKNISEPMNSLKAVCNFFYGCYIGVKTEQLKVCCLDDNLRVVSCVTVEDGGVNTVPVNVRKIVEATYHSNCSLIILAHNHPNGSPIPSDKDIQVTRQLLDTLSAVGIKLLDHVIVGPKNALSMKEAGYFNIFD